MRILFLVHQFLPEFAAGTERVTLNLARAAQSEGHHVEVFTTSQAPGGDWRREPTGLRSTIVEGVPVFAVPPDAQDPLEALAFRPRPHVRRLFEAHLDSRPRFHLAHVMHGMRVTDAAEALRERGVRYLVTLTDFFFVCHRINLVRLDGSGCDGPRGGRNCRAHCWSPEIGEGEFKARLDRLEAVLRGASAVAAVSEFVAERVRAEHPDLPLRVIPNGVDLLRFPRPRRRQASGPLVFGYLGTVSEAKGAPLLIEAFRRAAPANARLRVVGPCHDEALAARLAAEAQGAPISLEPPVPAADVGRLLGEFDVLCVPSQVPESFGLSLHEGFAAGLPSLVSDLGNQGLTVRRLGCGLAAPAADVDAWASAIRRACDEPETLAAWRAATPLPVRAEEEGFIYGQLYRAIARAGGPADAQIPASAS